MAVGLSAVRKFNFLIHIYFDCKAKGSNIRLYVNIKLIIKLSHSGISNCKYNLFSVHRHFCETRTRHPNGGNQQLYL